MVQILCSQIQALPIENNNTFQFATVTNQILNTIELESMDNYGSRCWLITSSGKYEDWDFGQFHP